MSTNSDSSLRHDTETTGFLQKPRKSILKWKENATLPITSTESQDIVKFANRRVSFADKVKLHKIEFVPIMNEESGHVSSASEDDSSDFSEDNSFSSLEADADKIVTALKNNDSDNSLELNQVMGSAGSTVPKATSDGIDRVNYMESSDEEMSEGDDLTMELTGQYQANITHPETQVPEQGLELRSSEENHNASNGSVVKRNSVSVSPATENQSQSIGISLNGTDRETGEGEFAEESPSTQGTYMNNLNETSLHFSETFTNGPPNQASTDNPTIETNLGETDMELTHQLYGTFIKNTSSHATEHLLESVPSEDDNQDGAKLETSNTPASPDEQTMNLTMPAKVLNRMSNDHSDSIDLQPESEVNVSIDDNDAMELTQPVKSPSRQSEANIISLSSAAAETSVSETHNSPREIKEQLSQLVERDIVDYNNIAVTAQEALSTNNENDLHPLHTHNDNYECISHDVLNNHHHSSAQDFGSDHEMVQKTIVMSAKITNDAINPTENGSPTNESITKEIESASIEVPSEGPLADGDGDTNDNKALLKRPTTQSINSSPTKKKKYNDEVQFPSFAFSYNVSEGFQKYNKNEQDKTPFSLIDFLKEIGTKFYDDLEISTDFSTRYRLSTLNHEEISHDDYYRANIQLPLLEVYELSCKELSGKIQQGKNLFNELQEQTSRGVPESFKRYRSASFYEQMSMKSRFYMMKEYTRQQAKQVWYQWRSKLISNILEVFKSNLEMLKGDKAVLQTNLSELEYSLAETKDALSQVKRDITRFKKIQNSFKDHDAEQIRSIKSRMTDINSSLLRQRELINTQKVSIDVISSKIDESTKVIAKLKDQCQVAEEAINKTKHFNMMEISTLECKFHILQACAGLKFVKTEKGIIFRFELDHKIGISVDVTNVQTGLDIYTLHSSKSVLLNQALLPKYLAILKRGSVSSDIFQRFDTIRKTWAKIRMIDEEIYKISLKFPTNIVVDNEETIQFFFEFLSIETKLKLMFKVTLPTTDVLQFPAAVGVEAKIMRTTGPPNLKDALREIGNPQMIFSEVEDIRLIA